MSVPSSIDRLPEEIRKLIAELRDRGHTIDEILVHLNAMDVEVSRSAMGRHVKKMEQVTARIRQSRQLAESVARSFGDKEQSQVLKTNIEILHSILMKSMVGADDEDSEIILSAKDGMMMATALEKLSKARSQDFDTEIKVAREKERMVTLDKAVEAVTKTSKEKGLTAETVDAIKKSILGVA